MTAQWYVLRIKPHKERSVYRYLRTKGVQVYFPTLKVEPKNPRAAKIRPFFPGYMFVYLDLAHEGENVLRWTPGTRGLVRFGGEPAVVSSALIRQLKKRLVEIQKKRSEPARDLQKGDRVRIVAGPLSGYEAIFDLHLSGNERVQILLAYLNSRPHRITLDANNLQKL